MKHLIRLIILLIIISAIACSKDKRIENSIAKNGGEWNISSITYTKIEQVVSGTNVGQSITLEKTESNVGTFTFEKDNPSVFFNYKINGEQRDGKYIYQVDNEDIIMIKVSMNLASLINSLNAGEIRIEQQTVSYVGEQQSKNNLVIEGGEIFQQITDTSTIQVSMAATINLSR